MRGEDNRCLVVSAAITDANEYKKGTYIPFDDPEPLILSFLIVIKSHTHSLLYTFPNLHCALKMARRSHTRSMVNTNT